MNNIFQSDLSDFIAALNISRTEYIVVGGYAVIMHGYYRTTQDLDIWVNRTKENYVAIRKGFAILGMPIFDITEDNFLGENFDVFSIGRSPFRIDIITKLKGLDFTDAFANSIETEMEGLKIRYLNLNDLLTSKKAAGRHRDLDDIEKLSS